MSVRGGNSPLWSPDGRELFYRDAGSVIAVPLETGAGLRIGQPVALFWKPYLTAAAGQSIVPMWDISPDGKKFLMMKSILVLPYPKKIGIVLNWFEQLKRLAPLKY